MGVIHADLHPVSITYTLKFPWPILNPLQNNILVDEKEHIQLIDFGLSNFSNSTMMTAGTLGQGAADYMAPEILALCAESDQTHSSLRYTEASDMFSVAQICWHVSIQVVLSFLSY